MRILFVQPSPLSKNKKSKSTSPLLNRIISKLTIFSPQLTFPMLAAVTPTEHSLKIINEKYQKINYKKKYDIVGITFRTFEANRAYEIADEFRRRGRAVVLGGWHPSALPEESKEHADSVVIGEAEETWPQLLNDYKNGNLQPYYLSKKPVDISNQPRPNRKVFSGLYLAAGIQASRGCPYGCKFCSLTNSKHGRIFRKRIVEQIIEEINEIPHKIINFYDASLTIDVEFTKSLFKKMKTLNKKLICNGNIDILSQDEELLQLAKEAGCIQWNIGFESISQASLNEANKVTNKIETYYEGIKKIHDHDMLVLGLFMFGFDNDKKDIFKNTLDFILKSSIDAADFSILKPFPKTPIRDELCKENRILTDDWSKYSFSRDIVFKPKNMSSDELYNGVRYLYNNFYSSNLVLSRIRSSIKLGLYPLLLSIIQNLFVGFFTSQKQYKN